MLFTQKAVFDACVLRLPVCHVIDASLAKLLHLSEHPSRKSLTLGSVAGSLNSGTLLHFIFTHTC